MADENERPTMRLCIDAGTIGKAIQKLRERVTSPSDWTADIAEEGVGGLTRFWFTAR